jgi:hypothetical protein
MNNCGRGLRLAVLAFGLMLLPRCVSLYDQGRLDRAKEAQTAFTDAKLSESLEAERTHTAAIHARELSVTERQGIAIRDAELQQIIGAKPARAQTLLSNRIRDRLDDLGGAGAREIAAKLEAIARQEGLVEGRADVYRLKKSDDDPAPICRTDGLDAKIEISPDAKEPWIGLQTQCKAQRTLLVELDALNPAVGEYRRILDELQSIENEQDRVRKLIAEADAAYKAEKKALEAERAANKAIDLRVPAEKLKRQLDAITIPDSKSLDVPGVGRIHPEAQLKWLETQQAHVSRLLAAAAKADLSAEVPPGVDDDLQIASALPGIAAQLNAGLRFPRVSALILQSEHLRLEAERVRTEMLRIDQHIDLLRGQRSLMVAEVGSLSSAKVRLTKCSASDLTAETFAKLPDECRNAFTAALIAYANSWTLGRIPQTKLQWAVVQLQHDRSLDQSASALAQWQNLIGVPLAALVRSYETGLKTEDIGRTINALGLGWIGLGVN